MKINLIKTFFIISLFFMLPDFAYGAPTITSINQPTITEGQNVNIGGTSFGAKISGNAAPLKWDNFNAGSSGQQMVNYDPYWSQGSGAPMLLSNENTRSGNNIKAVLKASGSSSKSSMVWRDNVGFATTGKIYLNYWVRMDLGTALTAGYFQVKNVEIAVGESQWGNGDQIMPMLSINHFAYPGPPVYTQVLLGNYRSTFSVKGDLAVGSNIISNVDYAGHTIVNGMRIAGSGILANTTINSFNSSTITMSAAATASTTHSTMSISAPSDATINFPNNTFDRYNPTWQNISMQVDMGTPGVANGNKWYWASAPNFSSTYAHVGANNRAILDAVASRLNSIKIGWYRSGFVNGSIADGISTVQYDDIYMDSSWARIEIGDAPTYDASTHREIQIPIVWNDGQIDFTVNKGSFNGGTAYLFVVDENGNASAGYPITFAAQADFTAPAAPTGLAVQ
jgi:hypothetical protein